MEVATLRSNTLASSNETRSSPIFLALSAFLPDAQIEAYIRASKSVQKRSKPFIAVIVTTDRDGGEVDAWLYVVRKTEGKQPFQIKTKFEISKLRLVNGLSEEDDNLEFELTFEKGNTISTVRWRAETVHKKKHLLISLWKVINENKKTPPQFLNVNYSLLQDSLILSLKLKQAQQTNSPTPDLALEYKYLTTEEERDLGKVTEGTDWVAENANKFMKKLTNELSGLDKANIHSIMSVENEVTKLFYMMDNAMEELCRLESLLLQYQNQLHRDRKSVEGTLTCYRDRETRNRNTKLLLDEAEQLLDQITFSPASEDDLKNQPLDSISQITRCTNAVLEIQEKLSMSRNPLLNNLSCVRQQTELMEGLLYNFSLRVIDTISKLTDPSAAPTARHAKLLPFHQLMQWLCMYNTRVFNDILKEYEVSSQRIYEKLIREYFDLRRSDVNKIKSTEKMLFSSKKDVSGKMKASSTSLAVKGSSSSLGLKGSLASVKGSTTSLDSVQSCDSSHTAGSSHQVDKYSSSVRDLLDFIEQTVVKEEEFLVKLFGFKSPQPVDLTGVIAFILTKLPTDLLAFVEVSYKQDIYHALPLFLYIAERYDEVDKSSYLEDILKRARVPAKKNFQNLFQVQCNKIIEQSRKSHKGTADSVLHFTKFIKYSEAFNRRRIELDEAYTHLCGAVESGIERLAAEQSKVPADVLLLENYHFLYMFLLKNKVESLDKFRKECHQKYNKHLTLYVEAHLGTPLERLSLFFDSVNNKLKSGVPPDEIGFTPALSKQELRALTVHYTAKEVRKGLEATMKKVEKHFTKEQNLFQVTCLSMQAEFIKQVEGYQELMQQCYPGSGLRLEFTVSHINDIFNTISKNKAV